MFVKTPNKNQTNHKTNPFSRNNTAFIQPKLKIGKPGDKYEAEADKMADQVVSKTKEPTTPFIAPSPQIQKQPEEEVQKQEEESIQEKPLAESITPVVQLKPLETEEELQAKEEEEIQEKELQTKKEIQLVEEEEVQTKEDEEVQAKQEEEVQQKSESEPIQLKENKTKVLELNKPIIQKQTEEDIQAKEEEEIQEKEEEEEQTLQMQTGTNISNTSSVENSLNKGGGNPLTSNTKKEMESGFGADFGNVRVYNDSNAVQMNKDLGSQAFTNGNNIYFNEGKYNPSSDSGKHLLAHELTHTVQQGVSKNQIQKKEETSDGAPVKRRMDKKLKDEGADDADKNADPPAIDPKERASKKGEIKSEGIAKPDINRPQKEKPKVEKAAEEGKEKQEQVPELKEEKEKKEEPPRADISIVAQHEAQAMIAKQQAATMKKPKKPVDLVKPKIETPKDSVGKKLPTHETNDKLVYVLHEIAKLFVEQAYDLKTEAFKDAKEGKKMQAKVHESQAQIESVTIGTQLMSEDQIARDSVNTKEEEALVKVEKDTTLVKEKAPELVKKAKVGNEKSSPMVEEAASKKQEMKDKAPDDAEAAADAKKQSENTNKVADGSKSMDDAFTQTGVKAQKYLDDAIAGEQKNIESKTKIEESKALSEATKVEITRINEHNTASMAEIKTFDNYPAKVAKETAHRAKSGDELCTAAVTMNTDLISTQDQYYSSLSGLESREKAQKRKDEEDKAKQSQEKPKEQVLTPEEKLLLDMSNMGEAEMMGLMTVMAEKDPAQLKRLETTLSGMKTEEESTETKEKVKLDAAGREKVDLMKMLESGDQKQTAPDPRQEQINTIEGVRTQSLGVVKEQSDVNFSFLTGAQKAMLSQKIAMTSAVSGLFNMDILQLGKGMIMGMINPLESLKGVVGGASKMATGIVNLLSAEAWKKDPVGNLLQSAADIATGLTMVLMSITGLATAITILSGVLIVLSWFTLSPVLAPVIGFMSTVISTVGSWTIVTGLIALELNYLTYIKNLHDASVAENTDELVFESDSIKQNMTDGFTSAMAVVGGKGDVAGAKAMQKSILKAGGAKQLFKSKGDIFKQGVKQTGKNIKNFVKGGVISGTKRLTKTGFTKVKTGIRNTLDKFKKGIKESPGNLKAKFSKKWKSFKEGFAPSKKAEVVQTPHGKLTKAPDGGDLGSFNGQKVKAEMEFPDGHKAKNLESGQCAICSNCETIKAKFGDELDLPENQKLSIDLKKLETELKAKPKDPDLIAKQKALHDNLYQDKLKRLEAEKVNPNTTAKRKKEIDNEINTTKSERIDNSLDIYDRHVDSGNRTRTGKSDAEIKKIKEDVQNNFNEGKVMNPETGRFGSPNITKTKRQQYLGSTPGKKSKTGGEVFDRMLNETPPTARIVRGKKEFFDPDNNVWRSINEADMGHITDAVTWWNKTGRKLGARSDKVRKWMLDSDNYVLEYYRTNRSKGSILGKTTKYLPPIN